MEVQRIRNKMPVLQKLLNRPSIVRSKINRIRSKIDIKTELIPVRVGNEVVMNVATVVIDTETGEPRSLAPLDIFVDGVRKLRGVTNAEGKLIQEIKFKEPGFHEVIVFFLGKNITRLRDSPSTVSNFEIRTIIARATNEDTGKEAGINVEIMFQNRTWAVPGNTQNLFPVLLSQSDFVTVKYPVEDEALDIGLFELEDKVSDVFNRALEMTKKYMPFKRMTITNKLNCPINVSGEILSRLRKIKQNEFIALKTTEVILTSLDNEELKLGDIGFEVIGWRVNNTKIDGKTLKLKLLDNIDIFVGCIKFQLVLARDFTRSRSDTIRCDGGAFPKITSDILRWNRVSPIVIKIKQFTTEQIDGCANTTSTMNVNAIDSEGKVLDEVNTNFLKGCVVSK